MMGTSINSYTIFYRTKMWKQDQNKISLKNIFITAEVAVISITVLALADYLWKNTGISQIDTDLQIVFIGLFVLLTIFAANYLFNRRW